MDSDSWRRLLGLSIVPALVITCGVWALVSEHNKRAGEARDDAHYAALPIPEVVVGSAPARPTKLSLPDYPASDLATDGMTWPRACSLLTDSDIRSVLPQASNIKREGRGGTLVFETKDYHPDPNVPGQAWSSISKVESIFVPESVCAISFSVPHKSHTADDDRIARLNIGVLAAGDPDIVFGFANDYYEGTSDPSRTFARSHGAAGCDIASYEPMQCARGPLNLTASAWIDALDGDEKRVSMHDESAGPTGTVSRFEEVVVPLVMAILLAKIPT